MSQLPGITGSVPNTRGITNPTFPAPIKSPRNPTTNDKGPIGQVWVNTVSNMVYMLTSIVANIANWINISGGGSGNITITGDAGGPLVSNSFMFSGGTTGLTFNGAGTTETLAGTLAIAHGGTNATSMANTDGVVYFDGTRLVTTSVGTAGDVLTSNGAGVAPTYQPAGGGSGDYVLIQTQSTASASGGQVIFILPGGYTTYQVIYENVDPNSSLAEELSMQVSTDGGSTFDSANYNASQITYPYSSPVAGANATTSTSQFFVSSSATSDPRSGIITIEGVGSTTFPAGNLMITGQSADTFNFVTFGGIYSAQTSPVNALRFFFNTFSTFQPNSGFMSLYGINS